MLLLALAIAPGIAISLFIYSRDRFDREPKRFLILAFFLGMLATIPPLIIQIVAGDVHKHSSLHPILQYAVFAYIIVALSEEASKFLVLRYYAYPKQTFNEPFDGIVYGVMI